jgi:hypothetical protein
MYVISTPKKGAKQENFVTDVPPTVMNCSSFENSPQDYFKCLCTNRSKILKECSSYKLASDTTQDRLNKYLGCNDQSLSEDEKHECFKDPVTFLCSEPHLSGIQQGFACRQAVAGALEDCDLSFDAGLCKICQTDADCKNLTGSTCNQSDEEIRKVHDLGFGECTYN